MGQAREVMNMVTDAAVRIGDLKAVGECYAETVSYTHLTLPTIYSV